MFERFSDRARRVLALAQEEARLFNHSFIGTEHILLGLIQEGEGLAAQALRALEISVVGVRQEVEETIGRADRPPSGKPPFTPRAKSVLELSLRAAMQLGHANIDTEHLLLGLIRDGESVGSQVLINLGADLESVRRELISLMSTGNEPTGSIDEYVLLDPDSPIDRFSLPRPRSQHEWVPPVWDRPSEGTLPAVLAIDSLLLENKHVAVAVTHLEVYPNGFTVNLAIRVHPRKMTESMERFRAVGQYRWPQVGISFADGTTARQPPGIGVVSDVPKDEQGLPVAPFVSMRGAASGPGGWRAWAWVYPLPPAGPFEILVAFQGAGLAESSISVDGTSVRAAAERATIIWT